MIIRIKEKSNILMRKAWNLLIILLAKLKCFTSENKHSTGESKGG